MTTEATHERLVDYLKRVAADLHDTRARLREVEDARHEPVAVVAMACRYPGGVESPEDLWELVASGRHAMTAFPADRGWDLDRLFHPDPAHPGTSYAREGGFLHGAALFDPEFFGISPREAAAIDPQQRLLLEVAWEALERAGIPAVSLRGAPVGVYAGTALPGFGTPHVDPAAEGHLVTGNAPSVLSGRIAYTLGLEGPAVTVDTACSSSLVALHLAAQALRGGECDLALAGGVTVMTTPYVFTEFARQRGLAADSRCKAFAEGADGTAFAEGAGLLVLERLSDARRQGHPVLAVLRGSAVNQDGASNGLTAPNGLAQQRVIRQALDNARLTPADVDAVEAHGTGTALGDPIEAQALLAAYGQDRPADRPLRLGAIKPNIGHTQGAAGVAGVIKMVMAMRHATLPALLHADRPTPVVDWTAGAVRLLADPLPWPAGDRRRRAGVSSFGISGTNAHLIVEDVPEEPADGAAGAKADGGDAAGAHDSHGGTTAGAGAHNRDTAGAHGSGGHATAGAVAAGAARPAAGDGHGGSVSAADAVHDGTARAADIGAVLPWVVSARSAGSLRAQAAALGEYVAARPDVPVAAVGRALAVGRSPLEHRAVVLGADRAELAARLADLAEGRAHPGVCVPGSAVRRAGSAFLFTGQGSQRPGMGRELHAAYPVFAAAFDEACAVLDPLLGRSLRELVLAPPGGAGAGELDRTEFTQAALFAVEVALHRLVESFGVVPGYVVGHSVGGLVAAHVAGVLSLPDAARLVAARGRLMQALPAGGAMVAVEAAEEDVAALLAGREDQVSLAAVNGPRAVVVSGDEEAVADIAETMRGRGVRTRRLRVGHAFHSPRIEPVLDEFRAVAATLTYAPPRIAVVSDVTGALADATQLGDPEYWVRHARQPVRFRDAVAALRAEGVSRFLELGPDPVLSAMARGCLAAEEPPGEPAVLAGALREGRDEPRTLLTALARLHADGEAVDFSAAFPAGSATAFPAGAAAADLPTYRFDRRRYWPAAAGREADVRSAGLECSGHPLLGAVVEPAGGGLLLTGRLALRDRPWLADHAIVGHVPLPGTLFVELALHAGALADCPEVEDLTLEAPLLMPATGGVEVQVAVAAGDASGRRALTVHSRPAGEDVPDDGGPDAPRPWRQHATATLAPAGGAPPAADWPQEWPPPGARALDVAALYERLAGDGYRYGPAFTGLRAAWRAGDEIFAEIALGEGQRAEGAGYALHPALLDAVLHPIGDLFTAAHQAGGAPGTVRLPFAFDGVRLTTRGRSRLLARITPTGPDTVTLRMRDETGAEVAAVDTLTLRTVTADRWRAATGAADRSLHLLEWEPLPLPADEHRPAERWALITTGAAEALPAADGAVPHPAGADSVATPVGTDPADTPANPDDPHGTDPAHTPADPGDPHGTDPADTTAYESPLDASNPGHASPHDTARTLAETDPVDTAPHDVPLSAANPHHAGPTGAVGSSRDSLPGTDPAALLAGAPPARHRGLGALRDALAAGEAAPGVVVLAVAGGPGGEAPARARGAVLGVLGPLQEWLADEVFAGTRLLVLTSGAVSAGPQDAAADPAGAAVWGLVRAAQAEHPGRIVLADVDAAGTEVAWDALRVAATGDETQLALRGDRLLVPRLVVAPPGADTAPAAPDPDGTVLITGGTGALGRLIARHLVEAHGVRHLLLAGRSGPDAEGIADFAAGLPADVAVERCDVTDPAALAALLANVPAAHPLTAVVHAAGVLDDGVAGALTPAQLDAVMAPKADAAWHLHRLTRDADLAAFVLFSSAASVLGSPGQGNYGAANAFLNALAEGIRAEGGTATALAWGLWGDGAGMTGHLGTADLARMARSGTAAMSREQGLALFDAALGQPHPVLVPARFDLAVLRGQAAAGPLPPLLRRLVRSPAPAASAGAAATAPAQRLAGLPAAERERILTELVRDQVATVLAHPDPGSVELGRTFQHLGLDSLTALELRNAVTAATGVRLPATAVFDYPTPEALVRHLLAQLPGTDTAAPAIPAAPAVRADADADPVVIVGMACHYPGDVHSPDALWQLVADGVDAAGPFPTDRGWDLAGLYDPDPEQPGRSYTREGGFLREAALFDAEFFGISPREALATDPQQRLLLETAWQAFEHARIDPVTLRGSRTAVVTGIMYDDYGARFLGRIPAGYEGQIMTGSTPSVASGRLAYTFGLEGPTLTVDTACSSSLVAMHLAAQALRSGECDLALAGGATVMATPNTFVEFSRQRGLAPDGRCKPFAAAADGTGWGEGAGLLVLERLSDAWRQGHPVLAVLRGSAVNQDGASNGLTAPNGPSQQRVIRQALANAALSPADVDAVEAHGTGTKLGDPIEAEALHATYGQERPAQRPLLLGSVKSNIGHTQAAAGVAGVIKMVMAMRHGRLPASLHIDEPTPHVEWSGGVELLREAVDWPDTGRPRRAAVSSFGISGTNAHIVLEQAPEEPEFAPAPTGEVIPWVLSARTPEALRAQAANLAARFPVDDVARVGRSLATTRTAFDHRAVIVADDPDSLLAGLEKLAAGEPDPAVVTGTAVPLGAGPVFVFPGQGSQWPGMGVDLLDGSPVFAARIAECEQALAPYVDWSLTEVLRGTSSADRERVDVIQPVLWAMMVALAAEWQAHGITPAAVIGHSQGEIAAATVAGALTLDDGARVVALRSQALRALSGKGAMASITFGPQEVRDLLDELGTAAADVAIAAHNGPRSTVVSGPPDQVAATLAAADERGARTRTIDVDYASHGPQVDQLHDHILTTLHGITPQPAHTPFYSTVTTQPHDTTTLTPHYWFTNLRQPVHLTQTLATLLTHNHHHYIEISPHPVLTPGITHTTDQHPHPTTTIPTLHRNQGTPHHLTTQLAHAHTTGLTPTWNHPTQTPTTDLPTYPFQHHHYWLDMDGGPGDLTAAGLAPVGHPQLSAAVELADGGMVLTGVLPAAGGGGWLDDHAVAGVPLVPGAALVEWALRAADEAGSGAVDELALHTPLLLPATGTLRLQITLDAPDAEGHRAIRVNSRPSGDDSPWTCHATGRLAPAATASPDPEEAGVWPPPDAEPVDTADFYARAEAAGYGYGPAFQGLVAAWRQGGDLLAEVVLPEQARSGAAGFGIHPALLDAALHPLALDRDATDGQILLPFAWSGVTLHATGATRVRVRMTPLEQGLRLLVADAAGAAVLRAESVTVRPTSARQLRDTRTRPVDGLFAVAWTPLPERTGPAQTGAPADWACLGEMPPAPELPCHADVSALLAATGPLPATVLVAVPPVADGPEPATAALEVVTDVLALAQQWLAEPRSADSLLVAVTRGAVAAGGTAPDPASAAVWGLLRSTQAEEPGRFVLCDLDDAAEPAVLLDAVAQAVAREEPQVAVRAGRVLVPRLERAAPPELAPPPGERAWRLAADGSGTVEGVSAVPCPEVLEPLAPGQVRVGVRAAGVNFRDVLILLGMYPDEGVFRGSEGAGMVLEVAPDVTSVAPGDRVFGLFEGAFGPVTVADARTLVPVPPGWTDVEAAAIPVAFLTAWYGLVDLGRLRAGDTVLIHAATGGVGTAAVQIARHLGAEVYATASPAKHGVLEAMGIDAAHRASSRDLDFEAAFREAAGSVDVVLNCLAGDFTDASLRLLGEGGRFIEMGKTDIRDTDYLTATYPGVDYQFYDLVPRAGLDHVHRMLTTLAGLFAEGALAPPPVTTWPLADARDALRHMSQAKHTGKLVLTVPPALNPDGTVLITGGTGTLGALLAEHLVTTWNITHLHLVSRRGPHAPGATELTHHLEQLGATVHITATDATDPHAVRALVDGIDPAHPLTGVIHAAGVLDDAVLTAQTPERLARVWNAKATAAAVLDRATAHLPLALFLVYSSAAGTLGSPGQANYAAANAYCDALAVGRHRAGRPAASLAWGLWAAASDMTQQLTGTDHARMSRSGTTPLSTQKALGLLDAAVRHTDPALVALDLDPRALGRLPAAEVPALLRALAAAGAPVRRTAAAAESAGWAARMSRLPADERQRELVALVRTHAATVLGHSDPAAVRTDSSFKELGFDSLTAVELRNRLTSATGLRLPAALVFDHPDAEAAARFLDGRLAPDGQAAAPADPLAPVLGDLARLEATLGGREVDGKARETIAGRLHALLSRLEGGTSGAPDIDGEALGSASDDEMFALIDQQLGSS
ncbi:SDR family NAD(P)-dependent oxidoreductase [Streptomyces sp. NPDC021020]|uniref:SDR family NAD(P)-dependent oxidoreductase n=1 Tax=Streptomyces sp. NPDC021020 TaxID=3365109 RepID=UPI0037AC0ED3